MSDATLVFNVETTQALNNLKALKTAIASLPGELNAAIKSAGLNLDTFDKAISALPPKVKKTYSDLEGAGDSFVTKFSKKVEGVTMSFSAAAEKMPEAFIAGMTKAAEATKVLEAAGLKTAETLKAEAKSTLVIQLGAEAKRAEEARRTSAAMVAAEELRRKEALKTAAEMTYAEEARAAQARRISSNMVAAEELRRKEALKTAAEMTYAEEARAAQARRVSSDMVAAEELRRKESLKTAAEMMYAEEARAAQARRVASDMVAAEELRRKEARKTEAEMIAAMERRQMLAQRIAREQAQSDLIRKEFIRQLNLDNAFNNASPSSRLQTAKLAGGLVGMGYEKLAIEQYGQAAVNASANMAELTRAATRVTVSTREVTEAGREHASVTNRQTVATQGHAAAMRDAHSGARGLASAFGAMWLTWGNIAPLLAGAAIGHSLVQAVKKGMEFEYTLTFIKALGEETAESVHKLGAAVLKLGSEGLYGPLELVKGLQVLEQAGVRAAEGMLVLPHVLDLATVGEMKMAEAAKTLVGVMNAFNLGILKSSFVGDVFAKAAAESQTSVEQMTQAMRTASVVGEMYGASMEDTATALTILAKLNITGTAAGTSFRNMLKELYAPTDAAAKVMKQLGMQAHDANGNLLPFSTVVYSLRETLKGYDRISQTNILQKLFGERGSKEAIAMLSLSRAEWDELQGKITGASGFMMGVAAELEASTKGVFKQAINNLEASMIKAFENTDNAAKNLAVGLRSAFGSQEMVAVLTSLVSGTLAFLDVVMKLGPALLVVGQGIAVFLGIRLLHIAVVAAAGALGTLLTAVKAVGVALAESLFVWATGGGLALGALVTPLALVTAGIVALGAAWWVFHTDTSSQVITDINNLSDALDRQLGKLRSINDELIKKIDLEMRGTTPGQYEVSRAQREIDTLQAAVNAARLVEPVEGVGHFGKGALKKKEAYDKAQRIITEGEAKLIESRKKLRQLEFEEERRAALQDGASLAEQINKNKKGGTDPLTAGTKKFSAADRDADNQLKKEVQAITDQFKLEEQLAKAQYATDVALEKAKLDAKLITQTQFANQRFAIEKEYLSKVVQAEQSAGRAIEALEGKADKKSVAMGFQNTRNENWNKIIVQQMKDMEDERKQLELAEIKARGEIQKFQSETLPKMQTKDKVEIEAQVSKRGGMLMSEADKAAAEASIAKTKEYSQVIGEQEAKLDEMARTNSTWTASMTGQVAVIDSLKTAMKSAAETAGQTARQTVEFNRSLAVGAAQAFSEYENSATNAAANIKGVFERAFKGLEDALVNFVKTGKMDFRSLADSIISDLIRIQVRQSITGPLAGMMKGMFNPIAAVAGAAAVSEGTNWVADFNNAQGGVYSSADLHGYANTIVSSPTLFRFAKGGAFRGLMGEAGPEAIMPLARGSDGMLGVRSQGGGAPNIEFNVINQTGSSAKARQSGPAQFDGSKWVIGIVLEAAETDPSFRSALGIGR